MRKLFSFSTILFFAVISSACINSYAVKELNEKASAYMQKGDIKSAIARLESSVDLDNGIYESRYNLAVAYLKVDDCEHALEQINAAETLAKDSSNMPNVYYTKGVVNNCLAEKLYKKDDLNSFDYEDDYEDRKPAVNDNKELAQKYVEFLEEANFNFEEYIKSATADNDKEQVENLINDNNELIKTKKETFGF